MVLLQHGRVIEVATNVGLVYLQFLGTDVLGMSMCRTLPGVHGHRPRIPELVRQPELWLAWEPILPNDSGLRDCGVHPVPDGVAIRYRSYRRDWTQPFDAQWGTVDPMTGVHTPASVESIRDHSPYEIAGYEEIARRIQQGWTPRDGVAEMHELWRRNYQEPPTPVLPVEGAEQFSSEMVSHLLHVGVDVAEATLRHLWELFPFDNVRVGSWLEGRPRMSVVAPARDAVRDSLTLRELSRAGDVDYLGAVEAEQRVGGSESSPTPIPVHHFVYATSADVARQFAESVSSVVDATSVDVREGPRAGEWGIHVFTEGDDVDAEAERLEELAARAGVEYDGHEVGPLGSG
ncbi:ribonuclease E inhibitor RraB [Euzebya sp.]|uniref:ribonuclease E inhibitor RraB n=1 Tax=Euzebya sp. TaxID=1971409 RepID=UPI00351234E5